MGDPATITRRTMLWLVLVAWSILSAWLAVLTNRALARRRRDAPARQMLAGGLYVLLLAVAAVILPPTGDPVAPSANLVWHFRLASLGGQALVWAAVGLSFGLLAWRSERLAAPTR